MGKSNYCLSSVLLQVKEKQPLLKKESLMVNALKRKAHEWASAFG